MPEPKNIAAALAEDMRALQVGGLVPTLGDACCVAYGHIIRQAVNVLAEGWQAGHSAENKLEQLTQWFAAFGGQEAVRELTGATRSTKGPQLYCSQSSFPLVAQGSSHAPISV